MATRQNTTPTPDVAAAIARRLVGVWERHDQAEKRRGRGENPDAIFDELVDLERGLSIVPATSREGALAQLVLAYSLCHGDGSADPSNDQARAQRLIGSALLYLLGEGAPAPTIEALRSSYGPPGYEPCMAV